MKIDRETWDGLIEFIDRNWTTGAEARDENDEPCNYDDPKAKYWDVRGACAKVLGIDDAYRNCQEIYIAVLGTANRTIADAGTRDYCWSQLADVIDAGIVSRERVLLNMKRYAETARRRRHRRAVRGAGLERF